MKIRPWLLLTILCVTVKMHIPEAYADSVERWAQRAINASSSLANGNYTSAAGQVIPGASFGQGYTNVHLNATSVGIHQGVPGLPKVNNPYVNLNSGFNAYGTINSNGQPAVSRNFQVQTGNRHIRNTTTFE